MRITLAILLSAAAWAQAPAPQPPPPLPPQLEQAARLISDYGNLARYATDNQNVRPPAPAEERVVFMGDSITDAWGRGQGSTFFPGKPYVNRGISGQVTPQMLLRFYPDVVALKPKAVVILAGTNDLAGNVGPIPLETTQMYLAAMAEWAQAANIKVVLASLLPVCDYHRPQTQRRPPEKILALNRWIKEFAAKNHHVYLDYFSAMVDEKGFFKQELTYDGLHPNGAGYQVMAPLAEKAIASALGSSK
jgi:lysophospholipase L1-like esterase